MFSTAFGIVWGRAWDLKISDFIKGHPLKSHLRGSRKMFEFVRSLWASLLMLGTLSLVSPLHEKPLRGNLKVFGQERVHDSWVRVVLGGFRREDKVLTHMVDPEGSADTCLRN